MATHISLLRSYRILLNPPTINMPLLTELTALALTLEIHVWPITQHHWPLYFFWNC